MIKATTSILVVTLFASTSFAQVTFNYDFNTSQSDFNSNFASTGAGEWSTETIPGWKTDGGANNTGRIQSGGNNNTAVLLTASDFSSVGASNTVSAWFEARTNGDGEIDGFNALGVGFTTSTSGTLNGNQYLAADFVAGGTTGTNVLNLRYRESGTINNPDTDEFSLVDGNWYELSNVVTKEAGTGNFSFVITLTDYGADGTSSGTLVDSYTTGTIVGMTTLWGQTELNAAFQGYSQSGSGGARGFDNFSATVVPEPGTYALLAGFLSLACVMVRRRRLS